MKMHHLLMIGAALVLIVLTGTGAVGGPLGTLLLVGLLLLCPLMMLGMHGGGREQGGEHAPAGSERRRPPREGVGRDGQ
jgi:formate hydrogenlyase subunit 4